MEEAGGVSSIDGVEGVGALGADLGGGAVMHRRRGVQADAGMTMDVVVVVEENGATIRKPCCPSMRQIPVPDPSTDNDGYEDVDLPIWMVLLELN